MIFAFYFIFMKFFFANRIVLDGKLCLSGAIVFAYVPSPIIMKSVSLPLQDWIVPSNDVKCKTP